MEPEAGEGHVRGRHALPLAEAMIESAYGRETAQLGRSVPTRGSEAAQERKMAGKRMSRDTCKKPCR